MNNLLFQVYTRRISPSGVITMSPHSCPFGSLMDAKRWASAAATHVCVVEFATEGSQIIVKIHE